MNNLLEQIKRRRDQLGLKQKDMTLRIGMSPQQYQRLEAKGNPRLDTLELVARGLQGQIMLIPQDKLATVKAILNDDHGSFDFKIKSENNKPSLADDPWKDILKDKE